jgi:2'-5' RNA ligase
MGVAEMTMVEEEEMLQMVEQVAKEELQAILMVQMELIPAEVAVVPKLMETEIQEMAATEETDKFHFHMTVMDLRHHLKTVAGDILMMDRTPAS